MEPTIERTLADQYAALWGVGKPSANVDQFLGQYPQATAQQRGEVLLVDQSRRWAVGQSPLVEEYCQTYPDVCDHLQFKQRLIVEECRCRLRRGEQVDMASIVTRFPEMETEQLQKELATRGISNDSSIPATQSPFADIPNTELPLADQNRLLGADETTDRPPLDTAEYVSGQLEGGLGPIGAGGANPAFSNVPAIEGYDFLEYIAQGGMGFVIKARHQILGRLAAIKMPLARYVEDAHARARFLREARAAAGLQHPQICPIYEVGQTGKHPFIVMGYVEGQTLTDWAKTQKPTAREAAEMLARVAMAVDYAHKNDVLHRDIKPDNIMVQASDGQPVLMDFGLAKELTDESSQLTQDGDVMGTPAYMSPEQAAGQRDRIGPATDVYALGAVLYYLLCGQTPFQGSVGEVLHKVQSEEPVRPSKLAPRTHRDLETICLKAMSKELTARYASAADLAEDLERFNAGEAILARRERLGRKLLRVVRRRPLVAAAVVAAVLLFSVGGSFAWLASQDLLKSGRDRQIAKLLSQINSGLNEQQWSEKKLQKMEALANDLEALSSDQTADLKRRITERFIASIDDSIHYARLDQSRIDAIGASLELLASRDSAQSQQLQTRLARRLSRWNDVFALEAPFGNLGEIFPAGILEVNDQTLHVLGATGPPPLVHTQISSEGRVEIAATFAASWRRAARIGITLNTTLNTGGDNTGYALELRLPQKKELRTGGQPNQNALPESFQSAQEQALPLIAELLRNGVSIQHWELAPENSPAGPLQLRVRREAGKLTLWVNEQTPLEFDDLFPLSPTQSGVFGLVLPRETALLKLRAARRFVAVNASALEVADDLYGRKQFSEAFAAYQQLATTAAADAPLRREAEFKSALCLLEPPIARLGEAEAIFSNLMAQSEHRWSAQAACRLWLLKLRQRDFAAADTVFEFLSSDNSFAELAASLPREVCDEIAAFYWAEGSSGVGLLQSKPGRVAHAKQFVAIQKLLNSGVRNETFAEVGYVTALQLAGRSKEALQAAKKFAEQSENSTCLFRYTELLCLDNQAAFALKELERILSSYQNQAIRLLPSTGKERAEILAALGRWAEVKEVLEDAQQQIQDNPNNTGSETIAIMQGFALEHLGYADQAKQHWRDACQEIRTHRQEISSVGLTTTHQDFLVLAALAEDLQNQDVNQFLSKIGSSPVVTTALKAVNQQHISSIYQQAWNTPRGKRLAEIIAFDGAPLRDRIRHAVALGAYGLCLFDALGGQASAEQEQLLWDAAVLLLEEILAGERLNAVQGMLLGATWKYQTGLFGWGTVARQLEPEIRGPVAYVFGHRYLSKDREQTLRFWETAAKDAAPDSTLARLVQDDIALLKAERGRLRIESRHSKPLQVRILQGEKVINTVSVADVAFVDLAAGDYTLTVEETAARIQLSSTSVSITTPGRFQVEIEASPDRTVARWALGARGAIDVQEAGGKRKRLTDAADLPLEPFQLLGVSMARIPNVNDDDLLRLQSLASLDALDIASTAVTDQGVRLLAGHEKLRLLDLSNLNIGNASLDTLKTLKTLQWLNISHTNIDEVEMEQLASLKNLLDLTLDGKQLTDRSAAALALLPELQRLILTGPLITDASLGRLATLSSLQSLILSQAPKVTGKGLAQLPNVREQLHFSSHRLIDEALINGIGDRNGLRLTFANTPLRTDAVERLQSMTHLKYLGFANTNVTQPQIDALRQALPNCEVTRSVNKHVFEDERRQAELMLRSGGAVTVAIVGGEGVVVKNAAELPQGHFHITEVRLANNKTIQPSAFDGLQRLWFLQVLDVRGTSIDDAHLRELAALPALERLDIRDTSVSAVGLRSLAAVKTLQTLILNRSLHPADLNALRTLTNLERLVITNANLTRQQAEELEKSLPNGTVQWKDGSPLDQQ